MLRPGAVVILALFALGSPARAWADLPASALHVRWEGSGLPQAWSADETRSLRVGVTNLGDQAWPDRRSDPNAGGQHAVRLSYCWRLPDGRIAAARLCRQARVDLEAPLAPGASVALVVDVRAPAEPGDYLLELDLVEELVRWFSDAGVTPLTLPVHVAGSALPARARPSSFLHVGRSLLLALGVVALLLYTGFAPTFFLGTRRTAPVLPLIAPVVGLGVLSAIGHALASLEAGTDRLAWPILAACAVLNLLAWKRGARPVLRRAQLGGWAAAGVALLVGLFPLWRTGYLTAMGGEIDGVVYVTRAEHMQAAGLARPPSHAPADMLGRMAADTLFVSGTRQGDQYLLALAASLSGLRPHRLFSVVAAVFFALIPLGVYALARHQWRFSRRAATLGALLAAVHPLPHYAMMNGMFSQTAGMGALPAVLVVVLAVARERAWRTSVLAGFLIATLVTLYPVYTLYALVLLALVSVADVARELAAVQRSGAAVSAAALTQARRLAPHALVVAVVAFASIPLGWHIARQALFTVRFFALNPTLLVGQGGISGYPHAGEWFGFVSRVRALYGGVGLPVPSLLRHALLALALALVLATAVGARGRARAVIVATLCVGVGAALHQRFLMAPGQGFPYGYFKVAAGFAALVVALMVPGALRLAHRWRVPRPAGAVLLAGFALAAAAQTFAAVPLFTGERLQLDAHTLALEDARALVPAAEPLLFVDGRWPGRCWDMYLLNHRVSYERDAAFGYPVPPEAASPRLIRYALVADAPQPAPGDVWFDRSTSDVLWSADGYRLLRRRDAVLAELRFVHAEARVALSSPLQVEVQDRRLTVRGESVPGGSFAQSLEWRPERLVVTLAAAVPTRLWVDDGEPRELGAGVSSVSLPPEGARLRAEGAVQVVGVQAAGPAR